MPNWFTLLSTALSVLLSKALSFRIGNYMISAKDVSGAPVHMTFAQIEQAVMLALVGQPGTVQSGDISITVGPVT